VKGAISDHARHDFDRAIKIGSGIETGLGETWRLARASSFTSPIALRTCDGLSEPVRQVAEPAEQQTFLLVEMSSTASDSMPSNMKLEVLLRRIGAIYTRRAHFSNNASKRSRKSANARSAHCAIPLTRFRRFDRGQRWKRHSGAGTAIILA